MEKKFIIPAVTFLAPLLTWIAYFVLHVTGNWTQQHAPWQKVVLCVVVGGLIVFSGVRCHQVGGPGAGGIARSGALLVMAALTFWKLGIVAAAILLAAAIVLAIQVRMEP